LLVVGNTGRIWDKFNNLFQVVGNVLSFVLDIKLVGVFFYLGLTIIAKVNIEVDKQLYYKK
jgi:hypothetical protein